MLHIVKHYYSLSEAFASAADGDDLLLVEDAVYAALHKHKANSALLVSPIPVYCLKGDVDARGLTLEPNSNLVDFFGFVTLTEKHSSSITWE